MALRQLIKTKLTQQKYKTVQEVPEKELKRTAILFSPHPDDETLACGGTLLKKIEAGAEIHVVFMTDGSRSHAHLMPEAQLARIRMGEARMACRVLGLRDSAIFFLGNPDGRLSDHYRRAICQVKQLISRLTPEAIYVPYRLESPADHRATHQIVRQALMDLAWSGRIFEFPVWFWHHWPWVPLPRRGVRKILLSVKLAARLHLNFHRDFNCAVTVEGVLPAKKHALAEYRSQMTRMIANENWATLGDVAEGDFLERFFQSKEIFTTYTI